MPRLSIIIVNYNSGRRLRRCLDCLARQSFQDFETIVIDNGSTDGSLAAARAAGVRLIEGGGNLGFAAANNRAAKEAVGDWLVFLNPDAYAEPSWLAELVAASERYPWADAFGSTQINANNPSKIDGAGDVFHILGIAYRGCYGWSAEKLPPEGECFSVCAAAAMYRKSAFDKLGGFDERFFCYGEDVDLGFRLRLGGGRAVQVRNARVLHEGSGVAGRHSDFTVYHGHRNRIWTAYKNLPATVYWPAAPARWILDIVLLMRFAPAGRGGPYWRALADGYAGLRAFKPDRERLQRERVVGAAEIVRAISKSPIDLILRRGKVWPIERPHESEGVAR